jgi:hypothetical protein
VATGVGIAETAVTAEIEAIAATVDHVRIAITN